MNSSNTERPDVGPIVSASHLAKGKMPAFSELEYAMIVTSSAMQRWTVLCTAATGHSGLTPMDVQVLHSVYHREREKSLADLCLVLNIEDTHLVNYALKKLESLGLVSTGKRGKEKIAEVTLEGKDVCERYRAIREKLLIESVRALGLTDEEVSKAASLIRVLSGQYDQAARSAASM